MVAITLKLFNYDCLHVFLWNLVWLINRPRRNCAREASACDAFRRKVFNINNRPEKYFLRNFVLNKFEIVVMSNLIERNVLLR